VADQTSGTHVWLVLMKAHRALLRHAEHSIAALDMCQSDFAVLEVLLHKGPQKLTDIARRIELTSGAMTTSIDRLEDRGLVERSFEAADRRARLVSLTAKGSALIRKVFAAHAAAMNDATDGLTKQERANLVVLLKKLGTSAETKLIDAHQTSRGVRP
jgi:MarR family transcriptional regulator, 2-MHQ and catechol-resistance regulon repressor